MSEERACGVDDSEAALLDSRETVKDFGTYHLRGNGAWSEAMPAKTALASGTLLNNFRA